MTINYAQASLPNIVALVNEHPITKYDFVARKKVLIVLNNIDTSNESVTHGLNSRVLDLLIEEELLIQHASKIGGSIESDQVQNAITTIEQNNNMPKNGMSLLFKERNLDMDSFKRQIEGEIIKQNIVNSLASSVSLSPTEIDVAIVHSKSSDFNVEAWVFTSRNVSDSQLKQVQKFKTQLKDCNNINQNMYDKFASAEKFDRKLRQMPNVMQSIVLDTKTGSSSNTYQAQNKFQFVFVCKKDPTITSNDLSKLKNFLSNKKMSQKALKFFKDLRSKAYIKTMM